MNNQTSFSIQDFLVAMYGTNTSMNKHFNLVESFLRIIGLTAAIVIPSLVIWYIWFGPGIETGPEFQRDPQGQLLQVPVVTKSSDQVVVNWTVSVKCQTNEFELQAADNKDDWGGGTATCDQDATGVKCEADLSSRGLSKGVTYNLQTHNYQCVGGSGFVSEVISFSL